MKTRRIAAALLLATLVPRPGLAQEDASEAPGAWRKYAFAAGGAVLLGGLASIAKEGHEGAFCAKKSCLIPVGVSVGAVIGFLLGDDLDERARARWTGAATIAAAGRSDVGLAAPVRLAPHPEGALALEAENVTLLTATLSTRRLLSGPRTRDAVALPARSIVLVAGDEGIWRIGAGGDAERVREDGATGLALLPQEEVAIAGRNSLERAAIAAGGGLERRGSADIEGVPQALSSAGDVLWLVMDTVLESRRGPSLDRIGGMSLGGYGNDLAVGQGVALVPLGAGGVVAVDIGDPARPREVSRLTNMGHAYAVAVAGSEAYVAAGAQGIFAYDISSPEAPRLLGVIPGVGLATDVLASGGALWVLDRAGRRVIRIEGAGEMASRATAGTGG